MPSMLLDKPYNEAADGLMRLVTNATREERTVALGGDLTAQEIVIEGDFERFVLSLMDTWGGHLRFVIRDTEAKDEEMIQARGEVAMQVPQLAHLMTAKAHMYIYKRQVVTIETVKRIGRREVSREQHDEEEWLDVTEEFGKLAQRELLDG